MTKGFYSIMLAQFLSSLADNALPHRRDALLTTLNEPAWMTPLLKLFFVVSYVIFAAWVGIFADSMPKGPRDVYHQRGKNRRLHHHAVRYPSSSCLRHCRSGRCSLLACKIRLLLSCFRPKNL